MTSVRKSIWLPLAAALFMSLPPSPATRAASPGDVEASIARAKQYLYRIQKDGNWERVQKRDQDSISANLSDVSEHVGHLDVGQGWQRRHFEVVAHAGHRHRPRDAVDDDPRQPTFRPVYPLRVRQRWRETGLAWPMPVGWWQPAQVLA
jgi:hypothetical protein